MHFWTLKKLVTVNKLCHVPHVSRIITSGIIFAEIPFAVSKEWVRFWPHVSLVTNVKMFLKSPSKNTEEKEKEKSFLCYTQMQQSHSQEEIATF